MQTMDVTSWGNFKAVVVTNKQLPIQYSEVEFRYDVFAQDGIFLWRYSIPKDGGADVLDFESNYKANANGLIAFASSDTLSDFSGETSATPAESVEILPSRLYRKYLFIQNVDSEPIWINFTDPATLGQPSLLLSPGASFVMEGSSATTESVNAISRAASVEYTVKEK